MRRTRSAIRRRIVADKRDEGQDGQDGRDGQDGQDGRDRQVGQDGHDVQVAGAEQVTSMENPHDVDAVVDADREALPRRASAELKAIVEALIFASPEPLTPKALYKLLDTEPHEDVQAALTELKREYERPGGLQLVEVAGGYQIVTRPDLHEWVRRLFHERSAQKLTVQALETLAVIAYRQPITAAEIAEVRGVNTSGVLNTLLERHLVKIVGRKRVVGRPFLYATTKEFLIRFGLNDLGDLPAVEDMAEALGLDAPILTEQATRDEDLPLREPDAGEPPGEEPGGSIH
jgi:segregation and condensation protein B